MNDASGRQELAAIVGLLAGIIALLLAPTPLFGLIVGLFAVGASMVGWRSPRRKVALTGLIFALLALALSAFLLAYALFVAGHKLAPRH